MMNQDNALYVLLKLKKQIYGERPLKDIPYMINQVLGVSGCGAFDRNEHDDFYELVNKYKESKGMVMISEKEQKIVDAVNALQGECDLRNIMIPLGSVRVVLWDNLDGEFRVGGSNFTQGFYSQICTIEKFKQCVEEMSLNGDAMMLAAYAMSPDKQPLTKENSDYSYYEKEANKIAIYNRMQKMWAKECEQMAANAKLQRDAISKQFNDILYPSGFTWSDNNDQKETNWKCVYEKPINCRCSTKQKETKMIKYEKVTDLTLNEIAKAMIDGEVFYSALGNSVYKWNGAKFTCDMNRCIVVGNYYRKVELTPMQAAKKACEDSLNDNDDIEYGCFNDFISESKCSDDLLFDDAWIEMCRTIVNAHDVVSNEN